MWGSRIVQAGDLKNKVVQTGWIRRKALYTHFFKVFHNKILWNCRRAILLDPCLDLQLIQDMILKIWAAESLLPAQKYSYGRYLMIKGFFSMFLRKNLCRGYTLDLFQPGNTHNVCFLWRTAENYALIIIKYPPLSAWMPTDVWFYVFQMYSENYMERTLA